MVSTCVFAGWPAPSAAASAREVSLTNASCDWSIGFPSRNNAMIKTHGAVATARRVIPGSRDASFMREAGTDRTCLVHGLHHCSARVQRGAGSANDPAPRSFRTCVVAIQRGILCDHHAVLYPDMCSGRLCVRRLAQLRLRPRHSPEAPVRIELTNRRFAVSRLTTWPRCRLPDSLQT
jgi:hypothetical protein